LEVIKEEDDKALRPELRSGADLALYHLGLLRLRIHPAPAHRHPRNQVAPAQNLLRLDRTPREMIDALRVDLRHVEFDVAPPRPCHPVAPAPPVRIRAIAARTVGREPSLRPLTPQHLPQTNHEVRTHRRVTVIQQRSGCGRIGGYVDAVPVTAE